MSGDFEQGTDCANGRHDWRRDPFRAPAMEGVCYVECAHCGVRSSRRTADWFAERPRRDDPKTWPRWAE